MTPFPHARVLLQSELVLVFGRVFSTDFHAPYRSEEIDAEWVHYPNPEGDTYFRHAQRRIVTQSNVRDPSTARWLLVAHDYLIELGRSKNLQIVEFEVYMHIVSESLAACNVEYYFVDSRLRHPFWLHVARVQDLGLAGFETLDHLSKHTCRAPGLDANPSIRRSIYSRGCPDARVLDSPRIFPHAPTTRPSLRKRADRHFPSRLCW